MPVAFAQVSSSLVQLKDESFSPWFKRKRTRSYFGLDYKPRGHNGADSADHTHIIIIQASLSAKSLVWRAQSVTKCDVTPRYAMHSYRISWCCPVVTRAGVSLPCAGSRIPLLCDGIGKKEVQPISS